MNVLLILQRENLNPAYPTLMIKYISYVFLRHPKVTLNQIGHSFNISGIWLTQSYGQICRTPQKKSFLYGNDVFECYDTFTHMP